MNQWCCVQTEPSIANRPFMVQSERIWQRLQKRSLVLHWLEYFWMNGNEAMIESDFWCSCVLCERWKPLSYVPALKELVYFKHQSNIVSFLTIFLCRFLPSNCSNNIVILLVPLFLCLRQRGFYQSQKLWMLCVLCWFNSCNSSVLCCETKQQISCKIQWMTHHANLCQLFP